VDTALKRCVPPHLQCCSLIRPFNWGDENGATDMASMWQVDDNETGE
jgi:hypothetical protein